MGKVHQVSNGTGYNLLTFSPTDQIDLAEAIRGLTEVKGFEMSYPSLLYLNPLRSYGLMNTNKKMRQKMCIPLLGDPKSRSARFFGAIFLFVFMSP